MLRNAAIHNSGHAVSLFTQGNWSSAFACALTISNLSQAFLDDLQTAWAAYYWAHLLPN